MSLEENKEIVRRLNEEVWNRGNLSVLDELVAPDCRLGDMPLPKFKEALTHYRQAAPDLKQEIHELLAEGNRVVMRWTVTGTNQGPDPVLPVGKLFTLKGITVYTVQGGKIVWDDTINNETEALVQLGVAVPLPA